MTKVLWRIAADTAAFPADEMSGGGAKAMGGRWNAVGHAAAFFGVILWNEPSYYRAGLCITHNESLLHFGDWPIGNGEHSTLCVEAKTFAPSTKR